MNEAIDHSEFIVTLSLSINCKKYLELGIYDGNTFNKMCLITPYCVGVDIIDIRKEKVGIFNMMTTDKFFKVNEDTFDLIFIDADHSYKQVIIDFENSTKILNYGGVIILHDTNPSDKKYLKASQCNDAYKINNYLKLAKEYNFVTLPIFHTGLTIVTKHNEMRYLNII